MNRENVGVYISFIATITLAIILLSMVAVFLIGLFNNNIDNTKIFEAISPAFQTIVGGFIGLIVGIKVKKDE